MNVPCFTVGSWFDFMCVGSVESFIGRQHKGGPRFAGQAAAADRPLAARRHEGDDQVGELTYPDNVEVRHRKRT